MDRPEQIEKVFTSIGGMFVTQAKNIATKLKGIKAFAFDWDGVFNDGIKDENGTSAFTEIDSMGTNLVRFSNYLSQGRMPHSVIISGERNSAAFSFSRREHFDACYYKVFNKLDTLHHLYKHFNITPDEIAYVFDDVHDFPLAESVGLRIFVRRRTNPLLNQFVVKNKLTDYVTGAESGRFAVREACELMMGLNGTHDRVITERMKFSRLYQDYFTRRSKINTQYFTYSEENIIEQNPQS